jgi:hypothetical protein
MQIRAAISMMPAILGQRQHNSQLLSINKHNTFKNKVYSTKSYKYLNITIKLKNKQQQY